MSDSAKRVVKSSAASTALAAAAASKAKKSGLWGTKRRTIIAVSPHRYIAIVGPPRCPAPRRPKLGRRSRSKDDTPHGVLPPTPPLDGSLRQDRFAPTSGEGAASMGGPTENE